MEELIIDVGFIFWDNPKRFKPKKYHVINVFEHEGERIITYKFYVKSKQRWYMNTECEWELKIDFEYNKYVLK